MNQTQPNDFVGIFFVRGNSFLEAGMGRLTDLPAKGAPVVLKERSIHQRRSRHCPSAFCLRNEPTKVFRVTSIRTLLRGAKQSSLDQVLDDREWEETDGGEYPHFDLYSLLDYLGQLNQEPEIAVLVDVQGISSLELALALEK